MKVSVLDIAFASKNHWYCKFYNIQYKHDSASLFAIERKYDLLIIDVFFMDFLFLIG